MLSYKVLLIGSDGSPLEERTIACASDDEAIDHAGRISHRFTIEVRQDERLVARFSAMPSKQEFR